MIDSLRTPAIDILAYATPRTHWARVDANVSKKSGRAVPAPSQDEQWGH
jgi:hypothetical protein